MTSYLEKNINISKHLEHILKQLWHVTNFNEEHVKTPAHGGEDGRNTEDFPPV